MKYQVIDLSRISWKVDNEGIPFGDFQGDSLGHYIRASNLRIIGKSKDFRSANRKTWEPRNVMGGYDSITAAVANMARLREESYQPIPENKTLYDQLYAEYVTLHNYFGCGENDVMKRLKKIKLNLRA